MLVTPQSTLAIFLEGRARPLLTGSSQTSHEQSPQTRNSYLFDLHNAGPCEPVPALPRCRRRSLLLYGYRRSLLGLLRECGSLRRQNGVVFSQGHRRKGCPVKGGLDVGVWYRSFETNDSDLVARTCMQIYNVFLNDSFERP